ncbi:MAG: hypothetical protein H6R04_688 [Burkholderiaceae bacterium]|nr:hypothetical protein [Burkholderiaceae bacterium]
MKTLFLLDGKVVSWGVAHQPGVEISSTESGSVRHDVNDDSPIDVGWNYTVSDGVYAFTEPDNAYPVVGPIGFQMLFTMDETVAATTLRETDKRIEAFWKLIDDPRTDVVDLNLETVQGAIEYTLTAVKSAGVELDVAARKAEILTGIVK